MKTALEQVPRASAVPVTAVCHNVDVQGTAVSYALENMSETVERMGLTIENIRQMNIGEGLAASFGDSTLDRDR